MTRQTRRDKGAGSITRHGGAWRAAIDISPDPATGARRRVTATAPTRTQALEKARAKAARIDNGLTPADRMPTVAEWLDQWMRQHIELRRAPATANTYRQRIRTDINPGIGAIPLDRLRPSHITTMENRIILGDPAHGIRPRSAATARLTHSILTTALDAAIGEGHITRNPAKAAEPPRITPPGIDTLTPGQAHRLIHTEPDPQWRLIWRLLYTLGLREGEALGITAGEIILQDGLPCLLVAWQLKTFTPGQTMPPGYENRPLGGRHWLTRPKTHAGRRLIPLPDTLHRELAAWTRGHPVPDGTPIFRSRRGAPICRETLRHAWLQALDRCGLPHVRIHSARHTNATILARLGVNDLAREAILGHADITVTNTVYTHVDARMLADPISRVGRLIESGDDR